MGGAQSLFYPDNPSRRLRAQQLADDCQAFQNEYDNVKSEIEKELGPYKDKMHEVLHAFGCRDLDDLDRLVKETATKEGLQQWQEIKYSVDGLADASDVFTTAMAVVAIAGIVISALGALAGGFGFLAGMAVTSSILAVLGVIGLIYDAISGAVQRSQLRDAIDSLFKLRIQIKFLVEHMRNVQEHIGGIKMIYAIFEKKGYDKEKIVQELRESDTLDGLQKQSGMLTYVQVAQDLLEMDKSRVGGSWRDEDPSWEGIAKSLDDDVKYKKGAAAGNSGHPGPLVAPEMKNPLDSEHRLLRMGKDGLEYIIPDTILEEEADSIQVLFKDAAPALQGPVSIILQEFVNDTSATVQLKTHHGILKADPFLRTIQTGSTALALHLCDWVISFATVSQAHQFASHKLNPLDLGNIELDVSLKAAASHAMLYLCADGRLDDEGDVLTVRYA